MSHPGSRVLIQADRSIRLVLADISVAPNTVVIRASSITNVSVGYLDPNNDAYVSAMVTDWSDLLPHWGPHVMLYEIIHGSLPREIRLVLGYEDMVTAKNVADALSPGSGVNQSDIREVRGLLSNTMNGVQHLPFGDKFLTYTSRAANEFRDAMRGPSGTNIVGRYDQEAMAGFHSRYNNLPNPVAVLNRNNSGSFTAKDVLNLHERPDLECWAVGSLAAFLDVSTRNTVAVMGPDMYTAIQGEAHRQCKLPVNAVVFSGRITSHGPPSNRQNINNFNTIIFPICEDNHWIVAAIVTTQLRPGVTKRNVILFDSNSVISLKEGSTNYRIGYVLCLYANFISGGWNSEETQAEFLTSPGK